MEREPINAALVWRYVGASGAVDQLRDYFDDAGDSGGYTGRYFERLRDAAGRAPSPNVFEAVDLVAVTTLSVSVPPGSAAAILDERSGELSRLLAEIPVDLPLWEALDEHLDETSPAHAAWTLLRGLDGIEWVTAGKLLARKRPALLPVYDNVVKDLLERTAGGFWLGLRDLLRDDDDLRARLTEIRDDAGNADDISLLRVLDVVLWMSGKAGGA